MLAGVLFVIIIVAIVVVVGRPDTQRPADFPTATPAADGDWTREPAELFAVPGKLVAASESRWMFAAVDGGQYRYSIKDDAGRTVGADFDAGFAACARTRSGVLGCQLDGGFYLVDLTTGARVRRAAVPTSGEARGPIPLADGWVIGGYGHQRVISASGAEKWRVPASENVVAEPATTNADVAPLIVTYQPTSDRRRVRDADTGDSLVECSCVITPLAGGFATETTTGIASVYTADGRKTATLKPGERVIAGSGQPLFATPQGAADAGPSQYRVRTSAGRLVWEGTSTNGPPRACGDWLLAPDGVISIDDGTRFASSGVTSSGYDCLGAGNGWIAMPDAMIVPRGRSWRPTSGALDLVDGRLVNTIANSGPAAKAVVVYSPTEPAAAEIPESVVAPDFTVALRFTFAPADGSIQATEISRVSYAAATGRWRIGADGLIQAGKSTIRRPARETFVVSDGGDVVEKLPAGDGPDDPCGPYSVALADDVARVVIHRADGAAVGIGVQPDPGHVVAAGARCVGYSDRYLALAPNDGTGITLLPLTAAARVLRLPNATGFASGRPFAVTSQPPTITVYPAVG